MASDEKDQGWQMSGFDEALLRAARLQGIKPPQQVFPPEMIAAMKKRVDYDELVKSQPTLVIGSIKETPMASEHTHEFFLDDHEGYCGCGATITGTIEQLEQQLAQEQQLNERLRARDALLVEAEAKAVTRYAQARALLERWMSDREYADYRQMVVVNDQLRDDTEAFLANGGNDGK